MTKKANYKYEYKRLLFPLFIFLYPILLAYREVNEITAYDFLIGRAMLERMWNTAL